MSTPRPSVYRRAAQLIDRHEETFSCAAISRACMDHGEPSEEYRRQFELMFGPDPKKKPEHVTLYSFGSKDMKHPFWCKIPDALTPEGAKYQVKELAKRRSAALLLMAAICENPA